MYHLTLTQAERKAIDWVGNRYTNGDDLAELLSQCTTDRDEEEYIWDYAGDVTFYVREHIIWQIRDNAESEDGYWPCFSSELASKMQAFIDSIV